MIGARLEGLELQLNCSPWPMARDRAGTGIVSALAGLSGLSREMLFLPSVMLNMVIARAGACWRPPFDDLVQDVAPA